MSLPERRLTMMHLDDVLSAASTEAIPQSVIHFSRLVNGDGSELQKNRRVVLIGDGDAEGAIRTGLGRFGIDAICVSGSGNSSVLNREDIAISTDPLYPSSEESRQRVHKLETLYGISICSLHEYSAGYANGAEMICEESGVIRKAWDLLDESGKSVLQNLLDSLITPYGLGMNATESNYGREIQTSTRYQKELFSGGAGNQISGKANEAGRIISIFGLTTVDSADDLLSDSQENDEFLCFVPDDAIRIDLRERLQGKRATFFDKLPLALCGDLPLPRNPDYVSCESPLLVPRSNRLLSNAPGFDIDDIQAANSDCGKETLLRLQGFTPDSTPILLNRLAGIWKTIEIAGFSSPCDIWNLIVSAKATAPESSISLKRYPHFFNTNGYVVIINTSGAVA